MLPVIRSHVKKGGKIVNNFIIKTYECTVWPTATNWNLKENCPTNIIATRTDGPRTNFDFMSSAENSMNSINMEIHPWLSIYTCMLLRWLFLLNKTCKNSVSRFTAHPITYYSHMACTCMWWRRSHSSVSTWSGWLGGCRLTNVQYLVRGIMHW